jgi:hypothetical protein
VIAFVPGLHHLMGLLHPTAPARADDALRVDPDTLQHAREAIRRGEFDRARAVLSDWDQTAQRDSRCLNVLGVLAVAAARWKEAKRLWQKAVRIDDCYEPPRRNLRRYYELFQFGHSRVELALGDEPEFRAMGPEAEHVA